MLRILDRYVLKQVAIPLVATMGIAMVMLLAERMVRILDNTLGKKNSFAVVFEMLANLVPHYLGTAIPAALFLGLLFGFSSLSKNSEIDAFMAAGVSLGRMVRPVAFLSLLFMLISLWVVGWVQPYGRYAYRALEFDVENVQIFFMAEEGVFTQSENRTFIMERLDRDSGIFSKVFIFTENKDKGNETVTAEHGTLVEVPGQLRPVLHLETGHRMTFKKPAPFPGYPAPKPPTITIFDKTDTPLGEETPEVFRLRGDDERELTLPEIIAQWSSPPPGASRRSMRAELNKRLVYILTLPMLPFLAVPFAVGHRRSQRSYRFGVAMVLILVFHEVIEQGSLAVKTSGFSPLWSVWTPFLLLLAFTAWRFYNTAYRLGKDRVEGAIEMLSDGVGAIAAAIARPFRRKATA